MLQRVLGHPAKAYRPVASSAAMRLFSSSSSPVQKSGGMLSLEALVGVSEAMLMYFVHARPGLDLDAIRTESMTTGKRLRKVSEIMAQTQLHIIVPFGYNPPSEENLRRFAMDHAHVLQTVDPRRDGELIADFQAVQKSIWGIVAKRAFGAEELKWLDAGVGRSLAMGVGSMLTSPSAIARGEEISKQKSLSPELRLDQINEDIIVAAYKNAMKTLSIPTTEPSFGMTYASMQILSMSDQLVAQTMMSSMSTLVSKVPLLRGEVN